MDQRNPYAPPAQREENPVFAGYSSIDATKGQRFLTVFIDNVVCLLLAFIVGFVVGSVGGNGAGGAFAALAMRFVYYISLETLTGRTVGKLIAKTRVVTLTGAPLTLWQVTGRTFARVIPFEPLSFLSQEPSGWHDRLSGTRVVQA